MPQVLGIGPFNGCVGSNALTSRSSSLMADGNTLRSRARDQSPIRNNCSHWRKSPLNPMLSATCQLPTGNQTAKLTQAIPLIASDALPFFAFPAPLLTSTGIAPACDKND